jgi:hypothetical protein
MLPEPKKAAPPMPGGGDDYDYYYLRHSPPEFLNPVIFTFSAGAAGNLQVNAAGISYCIETQRRICSRHPSAGWIESCLKVESYRRKNVIAVMKSCRRDGQVKKYG